MNYSVKQYAKAFYELTRDKKAKEREKIISDFLKFLAKKNDFKKINGIIKEFLKYSDEKDGLVRLEVVSKSKLSSVEKKSIKERIEKITAKKAIISEKIEPSLLGGVKIKFDDWLIDGSLENKLRLLKNNLT